MNTTNSNKSIPPVYLGKINDQQDMVTDITKMQHLLIVGLSGSGKSTLVHNILLNMMHHTRPDELQMLLMDSKAIEFQIYNGLPYLMIPVITDIQKMNVALQWTVAELKDRQAKFRERCVRNFKDYNDIAEIRIPRIVIFMDGFSSDKGDINSVYQIIEQGSAAGIHMIMTVNSTKHIREIIEICPSFASYKTLVNQMLPGIKQASVTSLRQYEFLYIDLFHNQPVKVVAPAINFEECGRYISLLKEKYPSSAKQKAPVATSSVSVHSNMIDPLFADAGRFIIEKDKASIGMLQRAFRIGFNRTARIMDQLCDYGVVGEEEGTKPRRILMNPEQFERLLERL